LNLLASPRRALLVVLLLGAGLFVLLSVVAVLAALRPDVSSLAARTPQRTALMRQREREAARAGKPFRVEQRNISYGSISPLLRRAVLVSEDDAFFSHDGLDWNEIKASARTNLEKRRMVRGGSTITQQLAKNLYLSGERSLTRKVEEAVLAVRLERALSKRRIFELYLNLIEWGDGVFGIEAAARHYYGVSASRLSPRQAVLLAAVIINPRRYSPLTPSSRIERRARRIASRLHARGVLDDAQYREAIGAPPLPPVADSSSVATPRDDVPRADSVTTSPDSARSSP